MKKAIFILATVVLTAALLLGACAKTTTITTTASAPPPATSKPATTTTPAPPATPTPKYGGTLKYGEALWIQSTFGWPGDPGWLNPTPEFPLFMDTILSVDSNAGVHPNLATAWQVAPDMKSITLTLKQGIKFHDGSDWNAEVCKWNLDLLVAGKYGDYTFVSSVDVVDPYTVRLNLTQYSNSILTFLGSTFVVSQQAYIDHGANKDAETWMRDNPVGTGPFKLASYTPKVSVKGTRNDDYWKGKPYLDAIEMTYIADAMTRAQSLQAGEIDIDGGNPTKIEADLMASGKGYKIQAAYIAITVIIPDSKNTASPFANPKVRQAVSYAIDREAIVKSLGYGYWISTSQYAVPGTVSYDKDLPEITQDLTKAKQLMTEAGYTDGFTTKSLGSIMATDKNMINAIQGMLAKIGINFDINLVEHPAYQTAQKSGWEGLNIVGKALDNNLNWALRTAFSQTVADEASLDKTDEFQALLDASQASKDYDPALVGKVLKYMYDNSMVVPLNATQRAQVMQPYVMDPTFYTFNRATIWAPEKMWLNK
jgi:peptide/nickel transport system substrate-binding protein